MPFFASDAHIDGGLDYLVANCDKVVLCAGQPVDYNDANVTRNLAEDATIAPAIFTKANGDTSGRKLSLNAAIADMAVTVTGTADHVAFLKTGTLELVRVNQMSGAIALTAGGTVTLNAGKIVEIGDPQ